jgi:DNA-binding response OmpR family regulator
MEQDGPPRALVVSNDHRFLSLIRNVLAEIGLEMCTVEGWDAVIEHAERAQPEIILLDLNVTHGSACAQALRELRAHAGTGKVPIVVCPTATWLVDEHAVAFRQPGTRLWQAPFDPSELLLTIEATLQETALTPDGHPVHVRR